MRAERSTIQSWPYAGTSLRRPARSPGPIASTRPARPGKTASKSRFTDSPARRPHRTRRLSGELMCSTNMRRRFAAHRLRRHPVRSDRRIHPGTCCAQPCPEDRRTVPRDGRLSLSDASGDSASRCDVAAADSRMEPPPRIRWTSSPDGDVPAFVQQDRSQYRRSGVQRFCPRCQMGACRVESRSEQRSSGDPTKRRSGFLDRPAETPAGSIRDSLGAPDHPGTVRSDGRPPGGGHGTALVGRVDGRAFITRSLTQTKTG